MSVIVIGGEDDFINHVSKNQEMPDLILAILLLNGVGHVKQSLQLLKILLRITHILKF